jgi:hypothetical protein
MFAWCGTDVKLMFEFIKSPMSIIDILSFLPSIVEFILTVLSMDEVEQMQSVAIFKVMRCFRLLRLFRYSPKMQLLFVAIRKSMDALMSITFFLILATIVSSTLMYYAERGYFDPDKKNFYREEGIVSPFNSIPSTMWWSISVLTTIGLAENFAPVTVYGKSIAGVIMLIGVLVIALPSLIVSRSYKEVAESYEREVKMKEELLAESNMDMDDYDDPNTIVKRMERQIIALQRKQAETNNIINLLLENLTHLKVVQSDNNRKCGSDTAAVTNL